MIERNNPWWIVLQGLGIVASIVVAFAIDAWWDKRQDEETASVLLQALSRDVSQLTERLEFEKQFNDGIYAALVTLLEASTTSNQLSARDVDVLIGKVIWYNTSVDWVSSALNALVADGLIELIDDPELRLAFMDLHIGLANVRAYYTTDEKFHHETLMPFLIEHAYMLEVTQVLQHPSIVNFDYGYPKLEIVETRSNKHLLESHQFQNLLMGKVDRYLDLKNFAFPRIELELKRTAALLDDMEI